MRIQTRGQRSEPERLSRDRAGILVRLRPYLAAIRVPLGWAFLFTILWSASNLLYGYMAKVFVDTVLAKAGSGEAGLLTLFIGAAVLLFALRGGIYFAFHYTWTVAGQRLSLHLRNELFRHLVHLPLSYFDRQKTGRILSSITNDVPMVNAILTAAQESISGPVLVVGGITLLFILNWPLALISVLCLPPIAAIISRATRRTHRLASEFHEHLASVTQFAETAISQIRTVKAFHNEQYEIEQFERSSQSVYRSLLSTLRVRFAMIPLVEYIGVISIVLVLWVGGMQIVQERSGLTVGDLTWFVIVLQQVGQGAKNFGNIMVNAGQAAAAAERIFQVMDVQNDIVEKPEALDLNLAEPPSVEYDSVSFSYSAGIPVLKDVLFRAAPGELVAIVGPTGAGKSTIAQLIPRFYDVDSGSVRVGGYDVRDLTIASLRSAIGIVPQDTILLPATVRENICYGRLGASEADLVEAARVANAWEFIERLPQGLDTLVGERGLTLSGGQRQRIAIARAVLRNPRILILDEATSSLDAHSEKLVQEALARVVRDRTTIVIAHRLSTIRRADRIIVLQDGRVVEEGRHEQLMAGGGLYSRLYETQFREHTAPAE